MKIKNKLNLSILIFLVSFIFLPFSKAFAERIQSFTSNIVINKDGTITIEETIEYDFGNLERHGLLRKIDFKKTNQENKTYIMDIDIISITDENAQTYNYSKSKIGNYIELKIGDADKLITGQKTYVIKYNVLGGITYFSDHDELYWNLTGNYWDIPIDNFNSTINLPMEVSEEDIKYVCYEGSLGSTSQSCLINNKSNVVNISSSRILNIGEGVTVAVSFPKNIVSVLDPREDKPSIFLIIMLVVISFLALLWYVFLPIWILINSIKEKRFTKNNEKIVSAWFQPPQYDKGEVFTPAETGFIVDKSIDHKELTATIIHLAQRGYLKIREDDKNHFTFIRLKNIDSPELKDFEQQVMSAIFKEGNTINDTDKVALEKILPNIEKFNKLVNIQKIMNLENEIKGSPSDIKDEVKDTELKKSTTLFGKIAKFNKYVESEVVKQGMFEKKPTDVHAKYLALSGVGLFTMNIFLAIISIFFGGRSARRTLKGIEKYSEAKSLFNFLKSQDEQLNFQSKNQLFFEKLLPYAAAFGVEKIWADRFKDLSMAKPDWYEGANFSNSVFIGSMTQNIGGSIKSAYTSSMSSTSSSSGFSSGFSGGSSGGGGGGGGGGSW